MSNEEANAKNQFTALELFDEQASERVRRVWHEGRWFFSILDAVAILTESPQPSRYWTELKQRTLDEGFVQLFGRCEKLKLLAADGKQRLTDCADSETLLRLIQSIPSPKAEPFKQWLARVGAQKLEELSDQRAAADSLRLMYRKRGYTDEWIEQRLQGIVVRDELTGEWRERGADDERDFAILTNILHAGTFDISMEQHREVKRLKKRDNLRDNMDSVELALTMLSEATSAAIHRARDSQGWVELQRDTHEAGAIAGSTRLQIEASTGQTVVNPENAKTLTARAQQGLLFDPDASENA